MKRTLFIILGLLVIIILLAVWVYILFFGGSQVEQEEFSGVNLGNTDTVIPSTENNPTQPTVNTTAPKRLVQLTTKPTAGYQEVQLTSSSSPMVWYVEAGVGHVYSINLRTGEEKRVSGTTIPLTQVAALTTDGKFGMFQSGYGNSREFIIGTFSTSSDQMTTGILAEKIVDFTASTDNTFLYAVQTNSTLVAKEYDPINDTSDTLFTVPFREGRVAWGKSASDEHFVFPKASSKLEGFLYRVKDGKLTRLPIDGYGLTALGSSSSILYSKQENNKYNTYVYNSTTKESTSLGAAFLPDKCATVHQSDSLICGGVFFSELNASLPDSWYQGITTFSDDLFQIYPQSGVIFPLTVITQASGQEIDVSRLKTNQTDERLYFSNKNNQTLWLFHVVFTENTN